MSGQTTDVLWVLRGLSFFEINSLKTDALSALHRRIGRETIQILMLEQRDNGCTVGLEGKKERVVIDNTQWVQKAPCRCSKDQILAFQTRQLRPLCREGTA